MSQQYGPPPGQGPSQQPPAQRGWGSGPSGYPPQFHQPAKSNRTQLIVIGGAALAVILIAAGVVLLVTGAGKKDGPVPVAADTRTPQPVGTLYTAPTPRPSKPVITKGPNDKGVEVGGGVWFTPAKGWTHVKENRNGVQYILPEPGRPGLIDGYFWVRQTNLMGAKAFAEHLVDIESNNFQHVVIGKGGFRKCPTKALKVCYATNYSAVIPPKTKGKPAIVFSGFVQAFEDHTGQTTATDSALESKIWNQRKQEILTMNGTLVRSF